MKNKKVIEKQKKDIIKSIRDCERTQYKEGYLCALEWVLDEE